AFVDTAAVMESLDLIITSDTALAHLAGALGRPTWIALRHVPDWRWLPDRGDSPWYPTMRLFRQSEREGWRSVFAAIERELRLLLDLQEREQSRQPEPGASHRIGTAIRPDQKKRMQGSQSPTKLPNIPAAFKQALSFHQTGQLGEAEAIYRQILETQPQHFDSF